MCYVKKKKNHQQVISVVVCILVVKVKLFLHLFQINLIFFLSLTVPVFHFVLERVLEAEGCRTFVGMQLNYTCLAVRRYSEPGCIDSG